MQDAASSAVETNTEAVRKRGRPSTITLDVVEKVARLIAKGMTEEQACIKAGVNHASLRTARHRNPEFETAIKRAQAEFLDNALDRIAAGSRGWQGLAWILERRHGEQFRRNTGLEVNALVGPYSPADLLARKPLNQWSNTDVDQSVGAWRLLRCWTKEQLTALYVAYKQTWGPLDDWTDEQLEWSVELQRRLKELDNDDQSTGELGVTADTGSVVLLDNAG